jgi:hypothetical protein
MNSIYFKPWIGSNYDRNVNKRLLVLGESHYGPKNLPSDFTVNLTREYTRNEWSHRFWTNIMQVVDGRKHWEIDRNLFWSQIAFYNYIQEPVAETPGVAPSIGMWKKAEEPFFQVLEILRPTHVLVLSKRLWENMTSRSDPGSKLRLATEERDTRLFPYENGIAKATWLPHPSYGFSAERWHPWVVAFQSM